MPLDLLLESSLSVMRRGINLTYNNNVRAIQKLLDEQVAIIDDVSKRVAYPKIKFTNNSHLRNIIASFLSCLHSSKFVLKGKRSPGNSDNYFQISKSICKLDTKNFNEFLVIGFDIYLSDLSERFEKLLDELNNFRKEADISKPREELANDLHQKFFLNQEVLEKAKLFRLFIRDLINLFDNVFTEFTSTRYKNEYTEWVRDHPEAGDEKLRVNWNDRHCGGLGLTPDLTLWSHFGFTDFKVERLGNAKRSTRVGPYQRPCSFQKR